MILYLVEVVYLISPLYKNEFFMI